MNLFNDCKLEGRELDAKVSEFEGFDTGQGEGPYFSTEWSVGGPIIERNHIFLDPPQSVHRCGGPNAGWENIPLWRAVVSASIRTYPNPHDSNLPGCVGRGEGATPLIAAMRAYVNSYGK